MTVTRFGIFVWVLRRHPFFRVEAAQVLRSTSRQDFILGYGLAFNKQTTTIFQFPFLLGIANDVFVVGEDFSKAIQRGPT